MVFAFIIFAGFLNVTGGGRFFIELALSLVGHIRGGSAKVAVIASSLFGTMSGSAVANVVSVGVFTIPMMKNGGFSARFAGAVEAVSSTGGQIVPPVMSAAAFIAAEFLEIPYASFAIAAAVPAILYYLAVYWQVDLESAKFGLKGLARDELPKIGHLLKRKWLFFVPILVLVWFLFVRQYDPSKAALYAVGSLIVASLFKKEYRLKLRNPRSVGEGTIKGLADVGPVCAGAGIVIGSITLTGLGLRLSNALIGISGGSLLLLLILAATACLILGMGVPTVPCYILTASLIAPAIIKLGVLPVSAHLFVFYFGCASMITPPVALASYVAAGIAGGPMMRTGFTAMRVGAVALIIPFLFVYNPALLLKGSLVEVAEALITAAVGVTFLAIGMEGYLFSKLAWLKRAGFLGGGLLLMVAERRTDIIGVALIAILFIWELVKSKRKTCRNAATSLQKGGVNGSNCSG
jgi:TRAP transporter 4TM/12TM fusion protein